MQRMLQIRNHPTGSTLTAIADAPPDQQSKSKSAKKRGRQRATDSQYYQKKGDAKYASYLRLALSSYVKMQDDYYGSYMGMWEFPADPTRFGNNHRFVLIDNSDDADRAARYDKTKMRAENRKEAIHRASVDTAQEVRHMARQLGMLTVDATADTISHTRLALSLTI